MFFNEVEAMVAQLCKYTKHLWIAHLKGEFDGMWILQLRKIHLKQKMNNYQFCTVIGYSRLLSEVLLVA